MEHEPTFIDISDNPDLSRRITEAMRRDAGRVVLRTADGPLAVVVPLSDDEARPGGDFAGLKAAAGSWRDEDTEAMIAEIYEGRRRSVRPPAEL